MKLQSIAAILLFGTSQLATAQSSAYFGAEGGYAISDIKAGDTAQAIANATGTTTTVRYDRGALIGRVFVGSAINDSLGLELGGFMSGSIDARYSNTTGTASESVSARGLDFSAKFMSSADWYARGGVHYSQVSGDAQLNMAGVSYRGSGTSSGAGFLVGAGISNKGSDGSGTYYEYRYLGRLGGLTDANAHMLVIGFIK
jgi:hypothetical protein